MSLLLLDDNENVYKNICAFVNSFSIVVSHRSQKTIYSIQIYLSLGVLVLLQLAMLSVAASS